MERTNAEKMWMMGVGLVGFVLVLIGYFFFISPQRDKTDQVNGQVATAEIANLGLQSRITLLNAQNAKLASYQEQLHVAQLALPATSGMPAFLRTLQSLSGTTSTTLTTLTVGSPTSLDGGQVLSSPSSSSTSSASPSPSASGTVAAASDPGVYSIPITAVVTGSTHALSAFLTQLQSVQPRAVLITNVVLGASSPAATTTTKVSAGRTTLALTMQAFVAPAPASAPATSSPSASSTAGS